MAEEHRVLSESERRQERPAPLAFRVSGKVPVAVASLCCGAGQLMVPHVSVRGFVLGLAPMEGAGAREGH